jgi:hypothetical protein
VSGVLYHWAPSPRRLDIIRDGLKPYMAPTMHVGDGSSERSPYLCFGPSPSAAWSLSGSLDDPVYETWDLFQVRLPEGADVRPLPYFEGRNTPEIRTYSAIPADHLWYVASRGPEAFLVVDPG